MNYKEKIIETATELFAKKGYEKTTIEEIIRETGCSKGGFYHHFKSKDEVLEYTIESYLVELKDYFSQLVIDEYDDFSMKFNQVYEFITEYKSRQLENWDDIKNVFIFSGNERMLRTLNRKFSETVNGIYGQIILQGLAKDEINVDYPLAIAELCTRQVLWIYEAATKTLKNQNTKESFNTLLDFSEKLISQQLGLNRNQIKYKACSQAYQEKILMMYFANEKEDGND